MPDPVPERTPNVFPIRAWQYIVSNRMEQASNDQYYKAGRRIPQETEHAVELSTLYRKVI